MSDPNDLSAFLDLAWERLRFGITDANAAARTPTFATVSPVGWPEARSVVLRACDDKRGIVEVQTDVVTPKVASLRANPRAALHIWDAPVRLQVRLSVEVEILMGSAVEERWAQVPEASRVSYGTKPDPGSPIPNVYAYEKPANVARYAVLVCHIQHIDLVELHRCHRRASFSCANGWAGQWLAP